MRRLIVLGGVAALLCAGPAAAGGAGLVPVQYGGPMDGGPGWGPPPGYGGPMMPYGGGGPYGGPGPRRAAPPASVATYHGFRIELADAGGMDARGLLAAAEHQVDIVDRSGVGPSMLALFRRVPIRVTASFAGGGHYSGGRAVDLSAALAGGDRPVLLHEYMHVLEWKTFPGRFRNATVGRYYEEALAGGLYPPESYMMSNPWEFFAVTASCYLNGTVERDPYSRAAIRERQPDYYAYLQRLFGPRGETASAAGVAARTDAPIEGRERASVGDPSGDRVELVQVRP